MELIPISRLGNSFNFDDFTKNEITAYAEHVLQYVIARHAPFEEVVLVDIVNWGLSLTRTVTLLKACAKHLGREDLFQNFKYISIQSEGAAPPPYIGDLERLGDAIFLDETLFNDIDEGEFPRLIIRYPRTEFSSTPEAIKRLQTDAERNAQQAVLSSLQP